MIFDAERIAKELFSEAKPSGDGWLTRCPCHADNSPSLSVSNGKNGTPVVFCHAGCNGQDIIDKLRSRGLAEKKKANLEGGLPLEDLAFSKKIDCFTLESFGVSDTLYRDKPAVKIPYFDEHGKELTTRYRIAMKGDRFRWKRGSKPCLYGLERIKKAGRTITLVEGESDCWTLWKHDFEALGIPGATLWNEERDARHLESFEKIFLVKEPDQGGASLFQKLSSSLIKDQLFIIELGKAKDVSGLYLQDQENFRVNFRKAQREAKPLNLDEISELEIEEVIAELNQKYAVVMLGGKCCILIEGIDPIFNRQTVTFSTVESIKQFFSNRKIDSDGRQVGLGHYWLTHPQRPQYAGVVFAPGTEVPGYYNLWRGFAVEPREGYCNLFLQHIRRIISSSNPAIYEYILNWLADMVQNPAEKPGTSIVLRGRQGTGKGVFVSQILKILEPHGLHVSHPKRLVGGFNNHLKDALLVFCDEGFWAGDKAAEGVLKALVTEDLFTVEPKGKDCFSVRNYIRLIIASNNSWVCPAGLEERRFFTLDVSPRKMQDTEYFKKIIDEMNNGGREAFLHFLLHRDIGGVDLRSFPTTAALFEQKQFSMSPVEKFWFELLQRGSLSKNWDEWDGQIQKDELHDQFVEFANKTGQRHKSTTTELGMGLKKITKYSVVRKEKNGIRQYHYKFPSIEDCRRIFEDKIRQKIEWPGEEEDE